MILPKTNLSILMVRNAVGYPSTDLGTLCTCGEPYVNKWSKYKPVVHNFSVSRPENWWKGSNLNCGINYLTHANIANLITSVNNGENQHPYEVPRGGVSSPYRLGDFAGYNSNSLPPVHAGNVEGTYYQSNGNLGIACMVTPGTEEDELTVQDIFGNQLDDMYYSVALRLSSGTIMWMSSSLSIFKGGTFVEVPMNMLSAGQTYSLYQFLSSYAKPSFGGSDQVGRFVVIPGAQNQKIKIESTDINIMLSNLIRNDAGVVSGNIYIVNHGSRKMYSNVVLEFRYSTSKPQDGLIVGERTMKLSDITVNANETVTVPFQSMSNTLPDFLTKGGKVLLYMNGLLQTQSPIMRPVPEN